MSDDGSEAATAPGRIVAIANQKGGVGKTTTAVNLASALAELGTRVLVVDLDPQGNASTGLGLDHAHRPRSIYDVLSGELEPQSAILETAVPNLSLICSTVDLAGAEIELVGREAREKRLAEILTPVRAGFDVVLVDTPPSLGLLTVNALAAAAEVLVPIQCEYYALEGVGQLLENVRLVRQSINPRLRLNGIVLTMYDGRTRLADQVESEIRAHFGDDVYRAVIPRSVRLSEAPGFGQPILQYDPGSSGARAYRALAAEFVDRLGRVIPDPVPAMREDRPAVSIAVGTVDTGQPPETETTQVAGTTPTAGVPAEPVGESAAPDLEWELPAYNALSIPNDTPPDTDSDRRPRRLRWPFRRRKGGTE